MTFDFACYTYDTYTCYISYVQIYIKYLKKPVIFWFNGNTVHVLMDRGERSTFVHGTHSLFTFCGNTSGCPSSM